MFDVDRGLLHTFLQLWRRPSRVVADYLRGCTVPYTHPGKYFLLTLALLQLIAFWTGAMADFTTGLTEESDLATEAQVSAALDSFFVLLAGPAVLLLAALQKRAWRDARLHYGEHLVFGLYIGGQQSLIWSPMLLAAHLIEGVHPYFVPGIALVSTAGYYLWSARRFFGGGLIPTGLRTLVVLTLTPLLYALLTSVTLVLIAGIAGS